MTDNPQSNATPIDRILEVSDRVGGVVYTVSPLAQVGCALGLDKPLTAFFEDKVGLPSSVVRVTEPCENRLVEFDEQIRDFVEKMIVVYPPEDLVERAPSQTSPPAVKR